MNDPHADDRPMTPEDRAVSREARDASEPGTSGPNLVLVERPTESEPRSEAESAEGHEDRRSLKVAEARIKILNGYYARSDVQRELAERLIFELGA